VFEAGDIRSGTETTDHRETSTRHEKEKDENEYVQNYLCLGPFFVGWLPLDALLHYSGLISTETTTTD
jgi:hypothetical protein